MATPPARTRVVLVTVVSEAAANNMAQTTQPAATNPRAPPTATQPSTSAPPITAATTAQNNAPSSLGQAACEWTAHTNIPIPHVARGGQVPLNAVSGTQHI